MFHRMTKTGIALNQEKIKCIKWCLIRLCYTCYSKKQKTKKQQQQQENNNNKQTNKQTKQNKKSDDNDNNDNDDDDDDFVLKMYLMMHSTHSLPVIPYQRVSVSDTHHEANAKTTGLRLKPVNILKTHSADHSANNAYL